MQVFKIGRDQLEEGEQLEVDNTAYRMYHRLNVEWPCLSFDIIADNLGANRTRVRISCVIHSSSLIPCILSLGHKQRTLSIIILLLRRCILCLRLNMMMIRMKLSLRIMKKMPRLHLTPSLFMVR